MFDKKTLKAIAAGSAIAGTLGLAALGIGSGVADAAPAAQLGTPFAQGPGWHGPGPWHGPGWDDRGWNGGPGWGPPPPPPPAYGYGYGYGGYGYDAPPPCVAGPLGLLHVCP